MKKNEQFQNKTRYSIELRKKIVNKENHLFFIVIDNDDNGKEIYNTVSIRIPNEATVYTSIRYKIKQFAIDWLETNYPKWENIDVYKTIAFKPPKLQKASASL